MKRLAILIFLLANMNCTVSRAQIALPFGLPREPTLSERIQGCDHLVLVKWMLSTEASLFSKATSTFRIIDVAKSDGGRWKRGDEFKCPHYFEGDKEMLYTMMYEQQQWARPGESDDVFWKYLKKVPTPETEKQRKAERLVWFLDYLENSAEVIAVDAYSEFSAADWETLKSIKERLPVTKLREWTFSDKTSKSRSGLYAIMLALVGDKQDRSVQSDHIEN